MKVESVAELQQHEEQKTLYTVNYVELKADEKGTREVLAKCAPLMRALERVHVFGIRSSADLGAICDGLRAGLDASGERRLWDLRLAMDTDIEMVKDCDLLPVAKLIKATDMVMKTLHLKFMYADDEAQVEHVCNAIADSAPDLNILRFRFCSLPAAVCRKYLLPALKRITKPRDFKLTSLGIWRRQRDGLEDAEWEALDKDVHDVAKKVLIDWVKVENGAQLQQHNEKNTLDTITYVEKKENEEEYPGLLAKYAPSMTALERVHVYDIRSAADLKAICDGLSAGLDASERRRLWDLRLGMDATIKKEENFDLRPVEDLIKATDKGLGTLHLKFMYADEEAQFENLCNAIANSAPNLTNLRFEFGSVPVKVCRKYLLHALEHITNTRKFKLTSLGIWRRQRDGLEDADWDALEKDFYDVAKNVISDLMKIENGAQLQIHNKQNTLDTVTYVEQTGDDKENRGILAKCAPLMTALERVHVFGIRSSADLGVICYGLRAGLDASGKRRLSDLRFGMDTVIERKENCDLLPVANLIRATDKMLRTLHLKFMQISDEAQFEDLCNVIAEYAPNLTHLRFRFCSLNANVFHRYLLPALKSITAIRKLAALRIWRRPCDGPEDAQWHALEKDLQDVVDKVKIKLIE